MLSDCDSVIRSREGQKQRLVRRTRSAFQREVEVTLRETMQTLQEITEKQCSVS